MNMIMTDIHDYTSRVSPITRFSCETNAWLLFLWFYSPCKTPIHVDIGCFFGLRPSKNQKNNDKFVTTVEELYKTLP